MSVRGKKKSRQLLAASIKTTGVRNYEKDFCTRSSCRIVAFNAPTFAASLSIDVPMIHRGYDWEGDNALGFTFLWREYVNFDEYFYVLTSGPWMIMARRHIMQPLLCWCS